MNTDAYFTIGDSHLVCEDYALSDDNKIVVCDGCSSSEMTDVGARLLALTAMLALNKNSIDLTLEFIKDSILDLIHRFSSYPNTMFDATLLMGKISEEYIHVIIIGDGVLLSKRKNQENIDILNFEYLNGYPYYIAYEIDKARKTLYFNENPELNLKYSYLGNNHYETFLNSYRTKEEIFNKYYNEIFFYKENYEWVGLLSDGVHTFRDENRQSISIEKIIPELTNFKTFTGDFVKRRLNKFKKDCIKKGWTHYDDLSMAVIYLGE